MYLFECIAGGGGLLNRPNGAGLCNGGNGGGKIIGPPKGGGRKPIGGGNIPPIPGSGDSKLVSEFISTLLTGDTTPENCFYLNDL